MIDFVPSREQDASPTIRGFKYQIQLTLQRWIDLANEEVLYLECGEDIDRVLTGKDAASVQRELEQIKARGRNITLRTPDVLSALVNFVAHLRANPGISLSFRYTTTALPGREKLSPLRKGVKGIDVWQSLRKKQQWTTDDNDLLAQLAQLISSAPRPEGCSEELWAALMRIVEGSGELPFAQYLMRFEWSCGSVLPEDISAILKNRLGELPGDLGPSDPSREQRYDQLIATLLDLLSRDGEKKLTRELLNAAIARPTLTEHDRTRLKLLEDRSSSQADRLDTLQARMQQFGSSQALPILFGQAAAELQAIDLSPRLPESPPLVATLARRTTTVDDLSKVLTPGSWLALHGDFGTGKSHLGFLIAERHGNVMLGLSMRGLSATNAELGLLSLIGNPTTLATIESPLPGVVLLDDLPDMEPQSRAGFALASFAKFILSKGRSIISTSRRPLSSNIRDAFGPFLAIKATPPFSNTDVKELFAAHQLNEDLLTADRIVSMNSLCGGHPMLLTALARHLKSRPDKPDEVFLEAILASQHRTQIDLETSRAVLDTVEVEACRNLLYRLAATSMALSLDEIRIIAAVEPALAEPTGCVARLDGLWLRRTANERYEISPLTAPLGREIPNQTNKAIHRHVARIVFRRGRITISEFVGAITSLLIAGEQNSAAVHILQGCMNWPSKMSGYADMGILLFFPLDRAHRLRPNNELPLRAAQAVTIGIEGGDPRPYIARIETLVQNATQEIAVSAIFAGSIMFGPSLERIPMQLAVLGASLVERFRNAGALPKEMRHVLEYPDFVHLLMPTASIHNWDDLDAFIELLGSLSAERLHDAMSTAELREGVQFVIFRPLFDENGGLTNEAIERLTNIEDRCVELNLSLLGAYAATAKIIVLGEYEKDVDRMLHEGDRARERFAADAMSLSVIDAMVGQQLYVNNRPLDGLRLLSRGLATPSHIVGLGRGYRLVDALSAAWESGEDPGPFTNELAEMLAGDEIGVPEALCQMHAQVAVVRWRQGQRNAAFAHLERGVIHFLELKDDMRTRQLGAGLAHVINYCVAVTGDRDAPSAAADGGSNTEGQPRMFSGTNSAMAAMWKVRQGPALLQWMLGRLAEALEVRDAASSWIDRALEGAIATKSPVLLMLLIPRAVAAALRSSGWADAIEAAVTHGRAFVFIKKMQKEGYSVIEDSVNFDPFELPTDRRAAEDAEAFSIWLLSRLIVSQLGFQVIKADDQSRTALCTLADALGAIGAQSPLASAWQAMAEAVRLSGSPTMSDQQHRDSLAKSGEAGRDGPGFVAHGLLAIRSDVRFRQAVVSQVGTLKKLAEESHGLGISVDAYAQATSEFWVQSSSRAPFRFSSPRELIRAIDAAPSSPALLRAKVILRAVLISLSATVLEEMRAWLISN